MFKKSEMQNQEIGDLRSRVAELEEKVDWLEEQQNRLANELSDTRRIYAKECAKYIANETFITRLSEDMFVTMAKEQFRKKWCK